MQRFHSTTSAVVLACSIFVVAGFKLAHGHHSVRHYLQQPVNKGVVAGKKIKRVYLVPIAIQEENNKRGDVWIEFVDGKKQRLTNDGISDAPKLSPNRQTYGWTKLELYESRRDYFPRFVEIHRIGKSTTKIDVGIHYSIDWEFSPDSRFVHTTSFARRGDGVKQTFDASTGQEAFPVAQRTVQRLIDAVNQGRWQTVSSLYEGRFGREDFVEKCKQRRKAFKSARPTTDNLIQPEDRKMILASLKTPSGKTPSGWSPTIMINATTGKIADLLTNDD